MTDSQRSALIEPRHAGELANARASEFGVPTRGLGTNWRARWAATVLRGSGYDRDMEPRVITAAEPEWMTSAEHDRVQGPIDALGPDESSTQRVSHDRLVKVSRCV